MKPTTITKAGNGYNLMRLGLVHRTNYIAAFSKASPIIHYSTVLQVAVTASTDAVSISRQQDIRHGMETLPLMKSRLSFHFPLKKSVMAW